MSALAIAGATAVSTGIALPFIGKREPRYRIYDAVKRGGFFEYTGRVKLQTRVAGVWWTVRAVKVKTDYSRNYNEAIQSCKNYLKEILEGKKPRVLFDTKFDVL